MAMGNSKRLLKGGIAAAALVVFAQAVPAYAQEQTYSFDIPAQDMGPALRAFARASRQQVAFDDQAVRGKRSIAVKGTMTARQALDQLLGGSGLSVERGTSGLFIIRTGAARGETQARSAVAENVSADEDERGRSEILVVGSRSQNVDIKRSEDDPQPYVVYDKEQIEKSGAQNLEDFFRTRVPMNTQQAPNVQITTSNGSTSTNTSQIDLRGLGTRQTLILIDGRRAPRLYNGSDFAQADVNGIPMSSIERIEILPATAGAIYGGEAVGGVINIIRKRDYTGLDIRAGFDGTFRGGAERASVDISGGMGLFGGRTQVTFSGSYSDSSPLYLGDNDLWRRGRELFVQNDPTHSGFYGYTPNIRASTNLVLDNGTPLNSNFTYIPAGYSGIASDGGAALLTNAGKYNLELSNDGNGTRRYLLGAPTIVSGNVNIRQEVTSAIDLFADFTISSNLNRTHYNDALGAVSLPANAANNPFRQTIQVFVPSIGLEQTARNRSVSMAATAGTIVRLNRNWTVNAEYQWSRSSLRYSSDRSPITPAGLAARTNGTLDVMRDVNAFPLDYAPYLAPAPDGNSQHYVNVQEIFSARASGKLFSLPGGRLGVTALLQHRREVAEESFGRVVSVSAAGVDIFSSASPSTSQSIDSAYLELTAPIVSARNAVPLIRELEAQFSVRYDRYVTRQADPSFYDPATPPATIAYSTNRVQSVDYVAALRWTPVRDIAIRASYSTGFLPPSISQLVKFGPNPSFGGIAGQDPRRGGELVGSVADYQTFDGGDPDLVPESSKSFSAGVIFIPSFLPNARVSADYTRIDKANEIGFLRSQQILDMESILPGRVVRGANLPGDPAGYAGVVTSIDTSLINIGKSRVEAWDFKGDYSLNTSGSGRFNFYGIATLQTTFRRQINPDATPFDSVDYRDGPLKWRGNAGIDWTVGKLDIRWNAQYYNSYRVRTAATPNSSGNNTAVIRQGSERIPSQLYHDLGVQYRFGDAPGIFSNLILSATVQNLFDKKPPVIADPYFGYSRYGDPRLRRFSLVMRKHF